MEVQRSSSLFLKASKSTEAVNRHADVKETAGYAIRSKTVIDTFWRLFVSVGFSTIFLLTLVEFT
jgi:hypothetical protein